MSDKFSDVDNLLRGLFPSSHLSLQELFDKKAYELELPPTSIYNMIGIQSRTIKGILSGTQKIVDVTNLIKIANFLQLPKEDIIKLYLEAVERNFPTSVISHEKIEFIRENFNLAVLRKAGLINSLTDFEHIEKRLVERLGLKSIFEYRKPNSDIAFSSGVFKPENNIVRENWIRFATACFEEISNPYEFRRDDLIKLFPKIRKYSIDVALGITEVIRMLYKLGITVVVMAPLQSLQLRGATFSVNRKPCIALTNYRGHYATLWFALVHELYHVLFDWEEIKANKYHLTDDANEELSVKERESQADDFTREFLFSNEKIAAIKPFINDKEYVKEFAIENQVHPSIAYVFNAFTSKGTDSKAWARAVANSPKVAEAIASIEISWTDERSVEEIIQHHKPVLYI